MPDCAKCGTYVRVPYDREFDEDDLCWQCLDERCGDLERLVEALDKLLAAYRLRRHPTDRTFDAIEELKQKLGLN